jgi:hypothetical protein
MDGRDDRYQPGQTGQQHFPDPVVHQRYETPLSPKQRRKKATQQHEELHPESVDEGLKNKERFALLDILHDPSGAE